MHCETASTRLTGGDMGDVGVSGKVAIVTGGSKGIGRACAEALVADGAQVMLASRKAEELARTAEELGHGVAWHAANAGNAEDIARCVAATMDHFGAVDILVNNAATSPFNGKLIDADLPRYDKTMDVNLRGPLVWIQEAWRAHMQEHGGCVINVSAIGASRPTGSVYALSKVGLQFITTALAVDLAPKVRVNAVAPGLVRTAMASSLWDRPDARIPPVGRIGEPADIAEAVRFLAGHDWITGSILSVDGGALVAYGSGPRFADHSHNE
jgi:NAD(P)-dependent dehydrogenase (short-subunit alcohol dehydrogenase family)